MKKKSAANGVMLSALFFFIPSPNFTSPRFFEVLLGDYFEGGNVKLQ